MSAPHCALSLPLRTLTHLSFSVACAMLTTHFFSPHHTHTARAVTAAYTRCISSHSLMRCWLPLTHVVNVCSLVSLLLLCLCVCLLLQSEDNVASAKSQKRDAEQSPGGEGDITITCKDCNSGECCTPLSGMPLHLQSCIVTNSHSYLLL